jgi:hypothetical protein
MSDLKRWAKRNEMRLFSIVILLALLTGCQSPYKQSETAAMDALLRTEYVRDLSVPGRRLVCRIDYTYKEEIYVYLGDWGQDFDFRIGFFKVSSDGSVWRNFDETGLDDRWKKIK